MDKDELKVCLSNLSIEEMTSRYTKSQLQSFYKILFDIAPASSANKDRLAYALWNFIEDEKRTKDLCKILVFQ